MKRVEKESNDDWVVRELEIMEREMENKEKVNRKENESDEDLRELEMMEREMGGIKKNKINRRTYKWK